MVEDKQELCISWPLDDKWSSNFVYAHFPSQTIKLVICKFLRNKGLSLIVGLFHLEIGWLKTNAGTNNGPKNNMYLSAPGLLAQNGNIIPRRSSCPHVLCDNVFKCSQKTFTSISIVVMLLTETSVKESHGIRKDQLLTHGNPWCSMVFLGASCSRRHMMLLGASCWIWDHYSVPDKLLNQGPNSIA